MLNGMTRPEETQAINVEHSLSNGIEELLPLALAVEWLPTRRRGKPPHAATLFRWAAKGLNGVKLEIVQVGGTKCTSREALARFFQKLTDVTVGRKQEANGA